MITKFNIKMRSVRCLLLLHYYVLTLASKPRSVNLALETTFEFNNKQDVAIIEKVRKFLDTIENAVDRKLAVRFGNDDTHYEFTDFLHDLITTIITYDDDNLKAVFSILNDELHNNRYRGSRFNEIMDNDKLRYHVVDILRKTNEAPAQFLRSQLKKNLKALKRKSNKQNTSFLNFLNILYKRKSAESLKQTVENLKRYGKRTTDTEYNLRDIIKTAVKTLVYDRYSNLDENVRRDVKTWLETVAKSSNLKANRESLKRIDEKRKVKTGRVKRLRGTSPRMYTFVTLYPEEIRFEVKKSFDQRTLRTPKSEWTERTVPDKNYFYLVKAVQPAARSIGDGDGNKLNSSSNSLEDDWRTHRRKVTSALWLARHHKDRNVPKVSKQTTRREILRSSRKPDEWHRRADQYDDVIIANKENDTATTETTSSIYLERIRKLETELNKMKVELTAKISSISNQLAVDVNKTVDEYSDYADNDREIFLKELNSSSSAAAGVDDTKSPNAITLATTKADAVFRSKVNDSQDRNDTNTNKQFETNITRELDGHNFTFRAMEDSGEVNNQTNNATTVAVMSTYETKNFNTTPLESVTVAFGNAAEERKASNNAITKQLDKAAITNETVTDASSNTTILDY